MKRKVFYYTCLLATIMLFNLYNVQASSPPVVITPQETIDYLNSLSDKDAKAYVDSLSEQNKEILRKYLKEELVALEEFMKKPSIEGQNAYRPSGTTQNIGLEVRGYSKYDKDIQTQYDIDNIEEFRRRARKNEIEDIAINVSVALGLAGFIILLVYTSKDKKKHEK